MWIERLACQFCIEQVMATQNAGKGLESRLRHLDVAVSVRYRVALQRKHVLEATRPQISMLQARMQ